MVAGNLEFLLEFGYLGEQGEVVLWQLRRFEMMFHLHFALAPFVDWVATVAAWLEEFVVRFARRCLVHCADNELEVVPAAVAPVNYGEEGLQLQAIHLGYRRVVVRHRIVELLIPVRL